MKGFYAFAYGRLAVGFVLLGINSTIVLADPPSPEQIAAAKRQGQDDGRPDGDREGDERGTRDGKREGRDDGYDKGYRVCYDREKQTAYDAGYFEGHEEGENRGGEDGDRKGDRDGEENGIREGRIDGDRRADEDSRIAAEPEGRRRGIDEAEQGNAEDRGYQDGLIAGDRRARETAQRVDYPRGRQDYYAQRFAEAVQIQDAFSQKQSSSLSFHSGRSVSNQIRSLAMAAPQEDCRYCNPRRRFNSPEEQSAYESAYKTSYRSNFRSRYDSEYRLSYDRAYRDGKDDGCREAERKDYRRFYDEGRSKGYDDGYSAEYRRSYDRAYSRTRSIFFRRTSDDTYAEVYDSHYRRHYEEARQKAFEQRTGELYRRGLDRGDRERFDQVYAQYALEEYARGQSDEARDFDERPVRVLQAEATETILNGLYEPGEPIRLKFKLRNFGSNSINPADLSLRVSAIDAQGIVISEPSSSLARSLQPKSVTDVSEALEFVISESRLDRASRIQASATYQGRDIGSVSISLTAKYLLKVEFFEMPKLLEGLSAKVKVKVTNQSPVLASGAFSLEGLSQTKKLEFRDADLSGSSLAVGASKVFEFSAIARTPEAVARMPMAFVALGAQSRRVGALEFAGDVPLINDYRITVEGNLETLRSSGITRVPYRIRNISSRLLFKGLQLHLRIKDAEEEDVYEVIGRNPQYLMPLDNGQSMTFVFPILARKASKGAVIELEVQEDGRTTVIHRANFREGESTL